MAFKFVAFFALLAVVNAGVIHTYAASPLLTKVVNPSVDAVARTQEKVVRSFDGTVSSYSKSVNTPYSSVHKTDTRINNNVYTPAVAKTVTYAAPAVYADHAQAVYAAPAHHQTVYTAPAHSQTVYAAPEHTQTVYSTPAHTQTVYSAPAHQQTVYTSPVVHTASAPVVHSSPAVTTTHVTHQSPVVYTHSAPAITKTLYTQQTPTVYAQAAPVVHKTVSYAAPAPTATTNVNHGPSATTYTHNAPGVSGYGTSQTIHYSPAEMVSHMNFEGFGTQWGF